MQAAYASLHGTRILLLVVFLPGSLCVCGSPPNRYPGAKEEINHVLGFLISAPCQSLERVRRFKEAQARRYPRRCRLSLVFVFTLVAAQDPLRDRVATDTPLVSSQGPAIPCHPSREAFSSTTVSYHDFPRRNDRVVRYPNSFADGRDSFDASSRRRPGRQTLPPATATSDTDESLFRSEYSPAGSHNTLARPWPSLGPQSSSGEPSRSYSQSSQSVQPDLESAPRLK